MTKKFPIKVMPSTLKRLGFKLNDVVRYNNIGIVVCRNNFNIYYSFLINYLENNIDFVGLYHSERIDLFINKINNFFVIILKRKEVLFYPFKKSKNQNIVLYKNLYIESEFKLDGFVYISVWNNNHRYKNKIFIGVNRV